MLEAKPSRLSRAAQLGARKSPSERGSLPPVPPSPSRPRVPQRGRAGPSQGRCPPPRGCPARRGGMWRRGSSARARALKPCRAHAGFLQREKCLCSACPTVHPGQAGPWPKSLLSLSTTPDNEVCRIYNLFCFLCMLPGIHCPTARITSWQQNKALHFCWLRVTSSGTPNQQSYVSLPWLEI